MFYIVPGPYVVQIIKAFILRVKPTDAVLLFKDIKKADLDKDATKYR